MNKSIDTQIKQLYELKNSNICFLLRSVDLIFKNIFQEENITYVKV